MKGKILIASVFFVCNLLPTVIFAQNKVVVIPLGTNEATGDAQPFHVYKGKTFSNSSANGLTGIRPPAVVPKTGQTQSYTNRPWAGDDGKLQKGASWPNPRFTDNGDGTVKDNLTGLTWLKDANCWGGVKWGEATGEAFELINRLNQGYNWACAGYTAGTYTDWRLPNIRELFSLVDFSMSNPSITEPHPFVDVDIGSYWSSTTSVPAIIGVGTSAHTVNFSSGDIYHYDYSVVDCPIWPVRSLY